MARVADGNARSARDAGLDAARVAAWRAEVRREIEARRAWLTRRAAAGFVRRAHGDLHLGNLCLWHGRPVLFDALEFDDALATIDLGYDLAFLLMDLDRRAGRAAANHVLNRYVARTRRCGDGRRGCRSISRSGRWCGRMCRRAGARPDAAGLSRRGARRICAPRRDWWWPWAACPEPARARSRARWRRRWAPPPAPWCCAATRRESACSATRRRNGSAPTPTTRRRTRAPTRRCSTCCATRRQAPQAVIVDATCIDPGFRAALAAAAKAAGRRFLGLWLQAPQDELERRIAARQGDASDATVAVLRRLRRHDPGAGTWRAVAADDGAAALAAAQEYVNSALTAC